MNDEVFDKIILGIDPGTNIMGYGLIGLKGKQPFILSIGIIHLDKYESHALRLKKIFERVNNLIETYKPDEMALEAPFFGKNVQSMLKLGRAQGVAMCAALVHEIPIFEYAPRMVKKSITGNGSASKEQVAGMLQLLLNFEEMPKHLDATDGLAVALCHINQAGKPQTLGKKSSKWADFLKENPNRKIG